ncbi:MAG: hypothetical protein K6G50_13980 [bacterium]|nr:hypothetical protein [bacterium]
MIVWNNWRRELLDRKCIFQFTTESCWCGGGGTSWLLFDNGDIVNQVFANDGYCRINDDGDDNIKETILAKVPEVVKAVRAIIRRNYVKLIIIPKSLDNGSCDGSIETFKFSRKEIIAFNITYNNLDYVKWRNPSYYKAFKKNMIYENMVLDIYNEIACKINKHIAEEDKMPVYECEKSGPCWL